MKNNYNIINDYLTTLRNLTHLIIGVKKLSNQKYYLTLNEASLNLTIDVGEIDRQLHEYSLGNDELINKMANSIYQIYKARMEHDDDDWDTLHDTILEATNKSYSRPELENIFCFIFPESLRDSSYHWGMSDTSWRDDVYEWALNDLIILQKD